MQSNTTTQSVSQFRSWIDTASPDDLLTISQAALKRVGSLDQNYRNRFADQVKADPVISRLFEHA